MEENISGSKLWKRLLCLGIFLTPILLSAQVNQPYTIKGKIIDSISKEAVPFISIVVKGTTMGTISDIDGSFSLRLDRPYTLQFSVIGYHRTEMEITDSILKKGLPFIVSISQSEVDKAVLFCSFPRPKEIYPTLEIVEKQSFDVVIYEEVSYNKINSNAGLKILKTKRIYTTGPTDFYFNPSEFQLKYILR